MHRTVIHNQRALGCILALLIVVMTLSPTYAWRCLDGKACPLGAAMSHSAHKPSSRPTKGAAKIDVGSCCRHRALAPAGSASVASSGMQCVLRHSDHPAPWRMRALLPLESVDCPAVLVQTSASASPVLSSTLLVFEIADLPPPLRDRFVPGRSPPSHAS